MQHWEQEYKLVPGGGMAVEQSHGAVRIVGAETDMVKIQAVTPGSGVEDRLEVISGSDGVRVTVQPERRGIFGALTGGPPVDLNITVPFGTACRIDTGSGPVEANGTRGKVQVEAGSGSVRVVDAGGVRIETGSGATAVQRADGPVYVESGSGRAVLEHVNGDVTVEVGSGGVTVRQVAGSLRVDSGSGRLQISDVDGPVYLETGSGGASVSRIRGPKLRLECGGGQAELTGIAVQELMVDTSSGGVSLELAEVHTGGSYRVECGSGGVAVALPPDANLKLSLESDSGKISHSGLPIQVSRYEPGELEAVLNSPSATLRVQVGSGGIRLQPVAAARPAAPEAPARPAAPEAPAPPAAPQAPAPDPGLMQAIRQDAALESSEHIRRILAMVQEGRLSPAEAEALIRALDDEEASA